MATPWRKANALITFHNQLKRESRAAPPATDPNEWGTWGDPKHQATSSDHNPKDFPGWGKQIVTAADFPDRPDLGLDARRVLDNIRFSRDPRVKYGISHGEMFSNYPSGKYPAWTWRPYTGKDGHFTHGHLSLVGDKRADETHEFYTQEVLVVDVALTPDQDRWLRNSEAAAVAQALNWPTLKVDFGSGPRDYPNPNYVAAGQLNETQKLDQIINLIQQAGSKAPVSLTVDEFRAELRQAMRDVLIEGVQPPLPGV